MQANCIGLPHLEHGRIPISARLYSGFGWIDDIMLPLYWAGALPISLSPITAYSGRRWSQSCPKPQRGCSILTTIENSAGTTPVWGTLRPSMQEALAGKRFIKR
jgi:hypothetical protein